MIKELQLRGITRTPSDRATADGGCAESLNVHLDQKETAPTSPPDDISDDIYGENTRYPIVFIHKMPNGNRHYIGKTTYTHSHAAPQYGLIAYKEDGTTIAMGTNVLGDEDLADITSNGNMVIAFTESKPFYFRFEDGAYIFMGSEIPQPKLEVISDRYASSRSAGQTQLGGGGQLDDAEMIGAMHNNGDVDQWNAAMKEGSTNYADFLSTWHNLWDDVVVRMAQVRDRGWFVAPFFLRYALKLYDGSYIHVSAPILCGGCTYEDVQNEEDDWIWVKLALIHEGSSDTYRLQYWFHNCFKLRLYMESYNLADWKDVVRSIDFFISEPVYTPRIEAMALKVSSSTKKFTMENMEADKKKAFIKESLLEKSVFYKVKSYDVSDANDMAALSSHDERIENSESLSVDNLVVQERLPDDYRSSVQYIPMTDVMTFNNRIMNIGAKEVLSRGLSFLPSQLAEYHGSSTLSNDYSYVLIYKVVKTNTGETFRFRGYERHVYTDFVPGYIIGPDVDQYDSQRRQYFGRDNDTGNYYFPAMTTTWLSYPDTRCVEVEVHRYLRSTGDWQYGKKIPMEPHPWLECSFAFLGWGTSLTAALFNPEYENALEPDPFAEEKRVMLTPNKIFLSEFENPFLFPAGNIITFPDDVVGAAVTSAPLSEGQVGDFDLYVFTQGGIRVLSTGADGTFSASRVYPTNLSRHVALPGTITPLEQAIVFVTEKGVMLLSGGQVTELSLYMNGRPYVLDSDLAQLLSQSEWADLVGSIEGEPIMAFMRNARAAYDSKGARLVFFNPTKNYQYVYMLDTQTWHKTSTGVVLPTILNSYPDCLVAFPQNGGQPRVLNFSTILDDGELLSDTASPVRGIIITRPFELDEPDVRKSISSIRIRGRYNRNDVQYILLGSFDGIHWKRLRSLRGGSYKLFRMVILTNLSPTERITWIDIDYQSRFANKLR